MRAIGSLPPAAHFMPHHTLLSPALAAVLLSAAVALAQPPAPPPMMAAEAAEVIRLWEGEPPGAPGAEDHDIPVVSWWPAKQSVAASAALVVCPGGGYGALADHEGTECERWLRTPGL
jgi:hypothetical protein